MVPQLNLYAIDFLSLWHGVTSKTILLIDKSETNSCNGITEFQFALRGSCDYIQRLRSVGVNSAIFFGHLFGFELLVAACAQQRLRVDSTQSLAPRLSQY
jgi:hypothetical protein